MRYISKATLLEARNYVSVRVKKPDTFAGLMLFLFCTSEVKKSGKYIKSDMQAFSRLADDAFYLLEEKGFYSEKYWYALLTNDWIDQVKIYFLNGSKISLKKTLYSIFWNKSYSDVQSIIYKYKNLSNISIVNDLFIDDLDVKDFNELHPVKCKDLISEYKVEKDYFTIKYDNSFVKKKAGDLSGAPFAQTLYAATEIKKIISVFDFDFIEKFNLSNNFLSNSERCLEYSHTHQNLSKPFLLLAGISGTGKTRFVREQAKASGQFNETYCLVSVRPDWHEPSDLLGYISRLSNHGQAEYITTDVLQFIAKAWRGIADKGLTIEAQHVDGQGERLVVAGDSEALNEVLPYWLCLDEMNLAPVEQYFADYLSVSETREWCWDGDAFTYSSDALLKPATINAVADTEKLRKDLGFEAPKYTELWQLIREHGLAIPFNLIVAGTVNMDETTHGFSRKVIDRALSFDFGEFFPNNYDEFFESNSCNKRLSYPIWSQARKDDLDFEVKSKNGVKFYAGNETIKFLKNINLILKNTPFELAYRALNELLLAVISTNPQDELTLKAVWDDFMMCKVLPRIEGDSDKLTTASGKELLVELQQVLAVQLAPIWDADHMNDPDNQRPDLYREKAVAEDATEDEKLLHIACRSKGKLAWMTQRLDSAMFTSFWP